MCAARRTIVARFFTAFFLALSCSPLAAAHPKQAAAKGEQVEKHITPSSFLCVLCASAVKFLCTLRANSIRPPTLAYGFYGPSANVGYAVYVPIPTRQAVSDFLTACAADAAGNRGWRLFLRPSPMVGQELIGCLMKPFIAAGELVYNERFVYDAVGNRTRQAKNGVETVYSYNSNNQLVESSRLRCLQVFDVQ